MRDKLKLVKRDRLDYIVPCPDRINLGDTKIRIAFKDGEYMYIPLKFAFSRDVRLTSDELIMIAEELKRLNSIQ